MLLIFLGVLGSSSISSNSRALYCGPSALWIRVCGEGSKAEPMIGLLLEVLPLGSTMAPSFSLEPERPGSSGQPIAVVTLE